MNSNNMMNMFIQMLQGGASPQNMMNMFGGNPMMQQAQNMLRGKNPQQVKQMIENIAKEKGINMGQLQQMAKMFGVKL